MAFQMKMPGTQTEDVQKALRQIHSWLYQLNENLQYTFSHLDEDNFTDAFLLSLQSGESDLTSRVDQLGQQVDQLNQQLGQPAQLTWSQLSLTSAQAFSASHTPVFCQSGYCVYLSGAIALTSSLAAGSSLSIATLSASLRPTREQTLPVASDAGALRLCVQPGGSLVLFNSSSSTLTSATFISVACNYVL